MLNLLPVRKLLTAIVIFISLAVLAAVYAGLIGTGDALSDVKWVIRLASVAAFLLALAPYTAWRWIPSLQRITFPYLGGEWRGKLEFHGPNGVGNRQVTLKVSHSFLKIELILDSTESTSRTLVVHAERDAGINRDRLYYVYLNERKEGVLGAGDRYRGLAVLRVDMRGRPTMHGDYFTERRGAGRLRLQRRRSNPWWALWK